MIIKLFNRFFDWLVVLAEAIHDSRVKNNTWKRYY